MATDGKDHKLDDTDRKVNTTVKSRKDGHSRLPHERDESPDCNSSSTHDHKGLLRGVIRQAASDLERGLVDTDLHGKRGVEKVVKAPTRSAKPLHGVIKSATPKTCS